MIDIVDALEEWGVGKDYVRVCDLRQFSAMSNGERVFGFIMLDGRNVADILASSIKIHDSTRTKMTRLDMHDPKSFAELEKCISILRQ